MEENNSKKAADKELIPKIYNQLMQLNTRNYKIPKEKHSKTLSDINHSRILYDPPSRVMEIKARINKWDLIKLKRLCTMKETISKVKRQPSE